MMSAYRALVSMASLSAAMLTTCFAVAQEPAEKIPAPARVFRASDLLEAELLRGPNYEIEENVPLRGYWYDFRLRTEWGVIPARGLGMLELRIREMHAIERARELSRDPQFVEGLLGNLVKTPRGALIILTEPIGTLRRAPAGIKHAVSPAINKVDRRAGTDTRRKLAARIECDPETTNPVLEGLLDQMARRKGLGAIAGKAGLGLALPGLGLIPSTAEVKDAVTRKLPHEINEEIDDELQELKIEENVRLAFLSGENYTTTRRLYYLQLLKTFEEVDNLALLVSAAAQARSESDGMAILREMRMLAAAHRKTPFQRIESVGLPLGIRRDGDHVLICPVDHLSDTPEVAQVIETYRQRYPKSKAELHLSGYIEPPARERFTAAGIEVISGR